MSIIKLFKKEEQKKVENLITNTNAIKIIYNGEHKFHLGSMQSEYHYPSGRCVPKCRLYITGEGIAKFSIAGKEYKFKIEPFVYLEEFESLNEAYIGACEMDRDYIGKELKKGVVEKISARLRHLEEQELKDMFNSQKITLSIEFEIDRKELFKKDNSDY